MSKYRELAIQQFFLLKEESLDNDRRHVGGGRENEYNIDGKKIKITVDGFWEKADWFDWTAIDADGNMIESGTYI